MTTLYGSFARIDIADALRVELDGTTVRVLCADGSAALRASALAADVARLERALAVVTRERDGLRARLDGQAAHRAAGDVEALAAVADEARRMEYGASIVEHCATRSALLHRAGRLRDIAARFRVDLRGEAVEGGEQQGVEGGDHGATVATDATGGKAHAE